MKYVLVCLWGYTYSLIGHPSLSLKIIEPKTYLKENQTFTILLVYSIPDDPLMCDTTNGVLTFLATNINHSTPCNYINGWFLYSKLPSPYYT